MSYFSLSIPGVIDLSMSISNIFSVVLGAAVVGIAYIRAREETERARQREEAERSREREEAERAREREEAERAKQWSPEGIFASFIKTISALIN